MHETYTIPRIVLLGILSASLFGLMGCGGIKFRAAVNALAAPDALEQRRYVLISGAEDISEQDLEFQEFAEYIEIALGRQGFQPISDPEQADAVIVLGYSVGDPETHLYTYSIPHWGQTGYSSATTYGSASTTGSASSYGGYTNYQGTTNYNGTTYYQPRYGITGYSTGIGEYTTFTRELHLASYEAESIKNGSDPRELWRLSVISAGSVGDLRTVMPYLVVAAEPYLGRETEGGEIVVTLTENDKRVKALLVTNHDNSP